MAAWLENTTGIRCGAVLFDLLFCLDTEAESLVLHLVLVEGLAVLLPRYAKRKGRTTLSLRRCRPLQPRRITTVNFALAKWPLDDISFVLFITHKDKTNMAMIFWRKCSPIIRLQLLIVQSRFFEKIHEFGA